MRLLFAIFVVVPILEMVVLIKVGSAIGAIPTVALVCLTAIIGVALIRQQGFSTLRSAEQRMRQGQVPAREMIDGICLAAGGAMLLTPGFITDAVGFMLLIPGLRYFVLRRILARFFAPHYASFKMKTGTQDEPQTLEGEFQRDDRPPFR